MLTLVDGVYYDVISNLTGPYARYTFAIIALCNHASLNQSTRRLVALNNFVEWKYNGNPGQWKMDFINFTREMYDSGATLEHLFMLYAFKSFEGKNSQVQSKISDDINDDSIVGPEMSIEGLATKYAAFLATLNAAKPNAAMGAAAFEGTCNKCGKKGHKAAACPTKKKV